MRKMLIFSALACMIRPTNAVIWVYLFGNLFWAVRFYRRIVLAILAEAVTVGYVVKTVPQPFYTEMYSQNGRPCVPVSC